jgi:uncharacterized RDD family membrane protein YckC/predicted RNA-binding Zn-ribbon protein involved in translation (DUF1610 family)
MSIQFKCVGCDRTLRVPDNAAGLAVNCPECGASNRVPETHYQKGEPAFLSPEERYRDEPAPSPRAGGRFHAPEFEARGFEEAGRRPCPMCGEMIIASALKCRYCGEVFDETLRRTEKRRGAPLASRMSRLGAALLDTIIYGVAMAPGLLLIHAEANRRRFEGPAVAVMLGGLGLIGIVQIVLLSTRGQTLGKMAAGVRIVQYEDDGGVGFGRAVFLRIIVPGLIGAFAGCFGLLDILFIFGEERRCIHDYIAGTKVIIA